MANLANPDLSNFSSSPHRLPTVSASQALQNLSSPTHKPISTTLRSLDDILQRHQQSTPGQNDSAGGLSRGQVTEICGPPGVGKTTFALQVSASALHSGSPVIWVVLKVFLAASSGLVGPRLKEIVTGFGTHNNLDLPKSTSNGIASEGLLASFHHFNTPTLPHLLALLTHESHLFPPKETGLIVLDSVSSLFTVAFPRATEDLDSKQVPEKQKKNDEAQWAASRKWAVMSEFVSQLGKLAAMKNIAILLTSQTTTRIRTETGAMIHSAVSGTAWDAGISARVFLFRDWHSNSAEESRQGNFVPGVRFAGVSKAGGVSYEGLGQIVSYTIGKGGLHEIQTSYASPNPNLSSVLPVPSHKRKRDEIGDSESTDEEIGSDEEFGWGSEVDPLVAQNLVE